MGPFKPYEGTAPYLFTSYSSKDKNQVIQAVQAGRSAGYRIWWDESIRVGDKIADKIVEHIEGCGGFLIFLSNNSCQSEWCEKEFGIAREEKKHIFPIRIDPSLNLKKYPQFRLHLVNTRIDELSTDPNTFAGLLNGNSEFADFKPASPNRRYSALRKDLAELNRQLDFPAYIWIRILLRDLLKELDGNGNAFTAAKTLLDAIEYQTAQKDDRIQEDLLRQLKADIENLRLAEPPGEMIPSR